ncbi:ATP-binding protein [Streptomyces sp. NPDC057900]|uniref:ATP-binding protein n=1 Tax=Streptomyces sp. NPDC057900 TaxID=3346274 RepID=UPI0036DFF4E2
MDQAAHKHGQRSMTDSPSAASAIFEDTTEIAEARALARSFLADVQALHGFPVSDRVLGNVQLVVSELVTNARKYAPGPSVLTLDIQDGAVRVRVWDGGTTLPVILSPDSSRIGQHGLEIVMAVSQSLAMNRKPVGKQITATIALTDDPGGNVLGIQMWPTSRE